MEALEWLRLGLTAIAAFYWLVCGVCNVCCGMIYATKAKSPSSLPLVGSIAGVVALLIQPFVIPDPQLLYWLLALAPDIAWGGLGIVGAILDRMFPRRLEITQE